MAEKGSPIVSARLHEGEACYKQGGDRQGVSRSGRTNLVEEE
jgi:hypothetical protein